MSFSPLSSSRDDGFEQLLATVNRVCGAFDANPLGQGFAGLLHDRSRSGMHLSLAEFDQISLLKRRTHTELHERCFYAVLQLQGRCMVEQQGQSSCLSAGDWSLLDSDRPFSVKAPEPSRQMSLIIPAHLLLGEHNAGDIACAERISSQVGPGKWARQLLLESAQDETQALSQADNQALLSALAQLLKTTAGSAAAPSPGAADPLYQRACAFIDGHWQDPALSPELVAAAVGVSLRGLYRLFASHGGSVAKHIRQRRLHACAQALRSSGKNLTTIALEAGFVDMSHFSSAFKAAFGLAPSAYRQRHQDGLLG